MKPSLFRTQLPKPRTDIERIPAGDKRHRWKSAQVLASLLAPPSIPGNELPPQCSPSGNALSPFSPTPPDADSPFVQECKDIKAKRRADICNVLALDPLEDRRLAAVVEPEKQHAQLALLPLVLADDGQQHHCGLPVNERWKGRCSLAPDWYPNASIEREGQRSSRSSSSVASHPAPPDQHTRPNTTTLTTTTSACAVPPLLRTPLLQAIYSHGPIHAPTPCESVSARALPTPTHYLR